jgi:hypothetical protein
MTLATARQPDAGDELHLFCRHCGGAVTVSCRPGAPPEPVRARLWPCPYAVCSGMNVVASRGEILDWSIGHRLRT